MKSSRFGRKAALTALLLAFTLFLSGCNLIVKDPEVDKKQVILTVNGEEVSKEEFTRYYNNAYERAFQNQQMMQQYGYPAQPIDANQVLTETLDSTARDKALHQKAHELGLDELTPEESADLTEQAKLEYADILAQIKEYYFPGTELTGEELDKALTAKAGELGLTEQAYMDSATESNLHNKLLEYAGRDIVISDEEIQAAYNQHIVEDKAKYQGDLNAYSQALSGGQPVYYTPAGYRYVRQILIDLPAEQQAQAAELEGELNPLQTDLDTAQTGVDRYEELLTLEEPTEEDKAFLDSQAAALGEETARFNELLSLDSPDAAQAQELAALKAKTPVYKALADAKAALEAKQAEVNAKLDEVFAVIQQKTDEVYARATAPGADFDAIVTEIGGDPAQPAEGYAVSTATTTFVPAFTAAAMALEKPGDISQPVKTNYGYHILRYVADIPEGEASLDSVREALRDELFSTRQQDAYAALEEGWLAEAVIVKYPERFKD